MEKCKKDAWERAGDMIIPRPCVLDEGHDGLCAERLPSRPPRVVEIDVPKASEKKE